MSSRGVLFLVWGELDGLLERAIAALKKVHPELPYHVERLPDDSTYLDKARMYELSPFDVTAYLDCDTVVVGNLNFAFEKAEKHGVALCINEAPWARRYEGALSGDSIEYNAGIVFFDKIKSKPFFDAWTGCVKSIDSHCMFQTYEGIKRQPCNDQAGMAKAFEDTGFVPFVLPLNWNVRPLWHRAIVGPVKIWHDYQDIPDSLLEHSHATEHETVLECVHFQDGSQPPVISATDLMPEKTTKIACAMSVPRLGFQDNFFSISEALTPLGIRPVHYDGVFWGQCLERVMMGQLDADWILSIDYDTVFTKRDVQTLIQLANSADYADAIAPIQLRRKSGEALIAIKMPDGSLLPGVNREAFDVDLLQVDVAHFGLTMFRTSALKKMEHPWFMNVPDETGNWGEKKCDEDIYFWRKWKATGNSLFIANRVAVGHLETLITWPNRDLEPAYQHACDFWSVGKPVNAWR